METDSRSRVRNTPGDTRRSPGRVERAVFVLSWAWALVWSAIALFVLWDSMLLSPAGDPPALLYPVPLVERLVGFVFRAVGVVAFYLMGLLPPILLLVMVTLPWLEPPSR